MREIKFRAKSIASDFKGEENNVVRKGDWVYGSVINDGDDSYIVSGVVECNDEYISIKEWCPVDARTVGQYTGLKDKNGVEIYEGDVVTVEMWGGNKTRKKTGVIKYSSIDVAFTWYKKYDEEIYWLRRSDLTSLKVIEAEVDGHMEELDKIIEGEE